MLVSGVAAKTKSYPRIRPPFGAAQTYPTGDTVPGKGAVDIKYPDTNPISMRTS